MDFFQQLRSKPGSTLLKATAGRGARLWYNLTLAFVIVFGLIVAGLAIAQLVALGQQRNPTATDATSVSAYIFLILTALALGAWGIAKANLDKVERRIGKVENVESAQSGEQRDAAWRDLADDSAGDVRDIARYGFGVPLPK